MAQETGRECGARRLRGICVSPVILYVFSARHYIPCDLYDIKAQHILEINLHVGASLNGNLNGVSR